MAKDLVTVELKGLQEVEKALNDKYGAQKAGKIMRPIINKGTKVVQNQLKRDMVAFKDTGATIDENIMQNARIQKDDKIRAQIKWDAKGPKQRFHLVHLNEWGYTRGGKHIKPRGFGVIEKSIRKSSMSYEQIVKKGVEQWLR